jgi:hypothetical protein
LKTSSAKAKGRELQQHVGKKIAELLCLEFGKDKDVASREMGQSGTDIRLSPLAQKLFPFSVETKNCNRWNIHKDIRQAQTNCLIDTEWLLIYKKKSRKKDERIEETVVLSFETFLKILKLIYKDNKCQHLEIF